RAALLLAAGLPLLATTAATGESGSAQGGSVAETAVPSKIYGRERRVWVYLPPGHSTSARGDYDLLVVFDGREYVEDIPLPAILDGLLGRHEAGPFVAVLTDNATGGERLADLANRRQFADFLAGELVPWARERWKATKDPRRTFVTGSSAGGLASAYAAYRHP